MRKAGIAADSLVLRGYGTGQQLVSKACKKRSLQWRKIRSRHYKALRQRAATGDAVAEKVLMAVENRSLLPADAMKIYFEKNLQNLTQPLR